MGIAVLLFGLLVGVFHYQGVPAQEVEVQTLAVAPEEPAAFQQPGADPAGGGEQLVARERMETGAASGNATAARASHSGNSSRPFAALAAAHNNQELAQLVADLAAARPDNASKVITIALAQNFEENTLGDIATLAAAATRAAPGQAPAIAGALSRALRGHSDPALAAAIATIVSMVPEQARDIGLVVGAVLGDDARALGMVAQTVAIATGEETFSSLSEGSGVSIAALMKESTGFGIRVPFDVPAYAAQAAPSPTRVAGGEITHGQSAADD